MNTNKFFSLCIVLAFLTLSAATTLAHPTPLTAPPAPIRQAAEFDQDTGALIAYPFGISFDVIKEMATNVTVCTIVANQAEKTTVLSQYTSHGIDTDHCTFLIAAHDTYWTRDYGPWFIYGGDHQQSIIDFTYNRPRPNDDLIPTKYAQNQSIPVYNMPLTTTGGNYMTDGQGNSISTTLVWEENPGLSHDQINQTMQTYCGITHYMVVPDINGDYIEHIDCWGKYLSPDTILIRSVPTSDPRYNLIEQTVAYFHNQTSAYGTPYHVARVYTPNNEPYTNSLILNNKVFVPIMGDQYDDDALQAYRDAMPGYDVLGFTGSWLSTDALHCRVMGIADPDLLYIHTNPLQNQTTNTGGFTVTALVHAYSGQNLLTGQPSVIYRVNTGNWQTLTMTLTSGDNYTTTIPSQAGGSVVSYYIHAEDASGRTANNPYIGAPNAFTFTVIGSPNQPPATPQTPQGNATGKPNHDYSFTTTTTDPENDNVSYQWDWGDGTMSDWLGPSMSGATVAATHAWEKKGTYSIRVKAKDTWGAVSDWSAALPVKMPLGRSITWRDMFQERFPVLFWLLTHYSRW